MACKLKIRPARLTDMEGVVRCAKDFFVYAGYEGKGMPLCENSFKTTAANHIVNGITLLLVDDDQNIMGGISGMPGPWNFNFSIKMVMEFYFWVDPEYRGLNAIRLLKAYEQRCIQCGAAFIIMISIDTDLKEGISRLYRRFGYQYAEQFFIKNLSGVKNVS